MEEGAIVPDPLRIAYPLAVCGLPVCTQRRTLRILMLSLTGLGMDQMTNMGKIPNCGTYILEVRRSDPAGARSYRLLPARPS